MNSLQLNSQSYYSCSDEDKPTEGWINELCLSVFPQLLDMLYTSYMLLHNELNQKLAAKNNK